MHKALSAMGAASFSEPHWLDQLHFNRLSEARLVPIVRVCVALEALTARLQTAVPGWERPTNFVFNPKSGGMPLARRRCGLPAARHAFMYRACRKVVQSFAGLKFAGGVPRVAPRVEARGVRALGRSAAPPWAGALPLAELSSIPVAMLTLRWIGTIRDWGRRARGAGTGDALLRARAADGRVHVQGPRAARRDRARALVHFGVIGDARGDRPPSPSSPSTRRRAPR